jgi:hypothetical protein
MPLADIRVGSGMALSTIVKKRKAIDRTVKAEQRIEDEVS